jgi:deazaflavin-dependent oxidoreductase (nitroreductase family)
MDVQEINRRVIEQYRAGVEIEGMHRDRLLLLTTTGAKTGRSHTAPMMFHRYGDRLLVIASNVGAHRHPDWYLNLVAHPQVIVEAEAARWDAVATPVRGAEREQLWAMLKQSYPFFAEHQAKTDREIPVVALTPGSAPAPAPGPGVRVRPGRLDDQDALTELEAAAWSPQSGFPSVIEAGREKDRAFFNAENPPEAHLVAELDGRVVGYVRLKPPTPLPENAHVMYIAGLAVQPAARGQGVAAAMLAASEQQALDHGARKLSLRVLSSNHPAIRLYERLGFEREGVLREEFCIEGSYVDDIAMAKLLRTAAQRGTARS